MSLYCGAARQEPQYQFNNYEQEKRHENRSPHMLATVFIFAFVAATTTSVQALTRYEYKVIQVDKANVANNQQLELLLNQLGQEGWLLIETSPSGTAIFQREKKSQSLGMGSATDRLRYPWLLTSFTKAKTHAVFLSIRMLETAIPVRLVAMHA